MSALVLKLIAAVSMCVDHVGIVLFPKVVWLRYIGRLAFPLYAYFIAEGFRYTHDRLHYFLRIFLLGLGCQIVYTVAEKQLYLGVLLTFSMSVAVMACVSRLKTALTVPDTPTGERGRCVALSALLCALAVGTVFLICSSVTVDYGFCGVMLPVLVSLSEKKPVRLALFSVGVAAVLLECAGLPGAFVVNDFVMQAFSLLTIPLVVLYNGRLGKYKLKYFFYIFYPAHLAVIYLISLIV